MAIKELTLQDAKDLVYKYREDEEVFNICRNLEQHLDGSIDKEGCDAVIQEQYDDAITEKQEAEDALLKMESGTEKFVEDVLVAMADTVIDKPALFEIIKKFRKDWL